MKQAATNNLKKNYSAWAIFSIFNNTKISEKPIVAWRMVNGKKITVDVHIRVIRKFRNEFIIRSLRSSGKKTLNDLTAGSEKINLYLPEDLVLCQCDVKQIDNSGDVVVKVPDMIAQIDRRKFLRLFIDTSVKVDVAFHKDLVGHHDRVQYFEKGCFDISAGGLSFLVSRTEAKYFKNNNEIKDIILDLDGKKTKISGLVVNIFDVEPDDRNGLIYKSKKICIQYMDPTEKQQKVINDYVFQYIDLKEVI